MKKNWIQMATIRSLEGKTSAEKTNAEENETGEGKVTNLSLVGFSQRYDEMGKVKGMDKEG